MSSRFGVSEIGRDPVLPPICASQPQAVVEFPRVISASRPQNV